MLLIFVQQAKFPTVTPGKLGGPVQQDFSQVRHPSRPSKYWRNNSATKKQKHHNCCWKHM